MAILAAVGETEAGRVPERPLRPIDQFGHFRGEGSQGLRAHPVESQDPLEIIGLLLVSRESGREEGGSCLPQVRCPGKGAAIVKIPGVEGVHRRPWCPLMNPAVCF